MVNVRDIESGKVRATRDLFGADQACLTTALGRGYRRAKGHSQ
jgi:hypothetical protein